MDGMRVRVICRFAVFAQVTGVTLDGLTFVVPHTTRVGLYKAAIENTAGQALVVVGFDCFEVVDGNSSLIADFAQANASLLAGESQLFAYTRCHFQIRSLSTVVGLDRLLV